MFSFFVLLNIMLGLSVHVESPDTAALGYHSSPRAKVQVPGGLHQDLEPASVLV